MITRFFVKPVNTQRLVFDTITKTQVWSPRLTGVMCHIQTWAGGEVGYEGVDFPTHQMWCNLGIDIVNGDRVIDGTKTYTVLNIESLDKGKISHTQIALSLIK